MPELPEVETVKRVLETKILNHKIIDVKIKLDKIIKTDQNEFKQALIGNHFTKLDRMGKWLMLELSNTRVVLSHLRMEGKYYYKDSKLPALKHEHVVFYFDNGMSLRYHDTRQFGTMELYQNKDDVVTYLKAKLGPEPFVATIDDLNVLSNKRIAIKTALLDQAILAGLGNIYVDEVLFKSRINPIRPSNKITKKDKDNILKYSIDILNDSIEKGGTTIYSFKSDQGIDGLFVQDLLVHTRKDQPCPNCNATILKTKVNGRGTYYCPKCQKK